MTDDPELKAAGSELDRASQAIGNVIESEFEELREAIADLRLVVEALTERVEELEAAQ